MEHACVICKQPTKIDRKIINLEDYSCNADDHYYVYRVADGNITQLKIRLVDADGTNLYLKIFYDQDRAEVWSQKVEVWSKKNSKKIINIGKAFIPNFSDLDKLKNKIKLYMLLS